MNEISNKESKNKDGRNESFMKIFFDKIPKNIFGLFFVFSLILVFFFGLGFGTKANAATKTVCGSGCDYATIAGAEAGASSGDTINVATGTYNENNPTFTKGLTWVAIDGNGTVIITNSGAGTYTALITGNSNALSITGFIFDALNTKANLLIIGANAQNKTLPDCTFQNATTTTFFFYTGHANINIIRPIVNEPDIATDNNQIILGSPVGTISGGTWNVTVNSYFALLGNSTNLTFTGNTVNILNGGGSIWDLNGTGIVLTTAGNTVSISGTMSQYVNGTRASTSGTVTMGDTLTLAMQPAGNPFDFTTAGAWTLDFNGMNLTTSAATFARTAFHFVNQVNPKVRNSTIDMSAVTNTNTFAAISATSTGTDFTAGGTVPGITINKNVIKSSSKGGYIILIGTEASEAGDNKIDSALITDNTIYGYVYYNPTASDGTCHAIFVGHNINATISKNNIYGGPYGVVLKASPMTYTSGGVFTNVFRNHTVAGLRIKGVAGVPVYNNTFYIGDETDASASTHVYISENGAGKEATGTILKNNIMVGEPSIMVSIHGDALTDFVADNNLYYQITGSAVRLAVGAASKTFAEWKGLGYDTHGVNANPIFTSVSDFHLQNTSPAINTGTNVSLTSDYLGNPIVVTPDIGAYEFQAPTIPTALSQYKADGTTAITSGTFTNEDNVVLKFNMSSSEYNSSDLLTPQVEIQESDVPFTNTVTNSGTAVAYSGTSVIGTVTVTGLTSGKTYHWQARVSNPATTSDWVSMGGSPDFQVDTTAPLTPIASPSAGTYYSTQNITLTADGSDSIRYSTSETPADCSAGTLYTTPISVSTSQTIYVRACDSLNNSSTATFNYVIATRSSSGSSVTNRVSNLIAMGNTQAAEELKKEFPNQISNNQIPLVTATPTTSTVITTSSTPIIINRILKLSNPRMWGDDIKALQTLLNTKGYDSGTPDGNFGPKTQAGVIAFQTANGLTPDGSVGTNTLNYLNGNQTTTTSLIIQPTVARTLKLLVPRMIGDDILTLQTYLNTNGYDIGTPDGVFGSKTHSAVIAFQTANGLTPDGLVGAKTREMMK